MAALEKGDAYKIESLLKKPEVESILISQDFLDRASALTASFEQHTLSLGITLYYATQTNDLVFVKNLITFINALKLKPNMPVAMTHAIENNNFDMVKCLLQLPHLREKVTEYDNLNLSTALKKGNLLIIKYLLEIQEVLALAQSQGYVLLLNAIYNDQLEVFDLLLQIPEITALAATNKNTILCIATGKGYFRIVKCLLQIPEVRETASIANNGALMRAIEGKYDEIIKLLLSILEVIELAIEHNGYSYKGEDETKVIQETLAPLLQELENTFYNDCTKTESNAYSPNKIFLHTAPFDILKIISSYVSPTNSPVYIKSPATTVNILHPITSTATDNDEREFAEVVINASQNIETTHSSSSYHSEAENSSSSAPPIYYGYSLKNSKDEENARQLTRRERADLWAAKYHQ